MTTTRLSRVERSSNTRRELLTTAERHFLRDGYHGATVAGVADDAGYTTGAVYRAYGSKAGMFLALFDALIDERLAEARAPVDAQAAVDRQLAALACTGSRERDERFVLLTIEFWIHAARDHELLDDFSPRYLRLRSALEAFAPPTAMLGPGTWATVTLGMSHGLALERLLDPSIVPDGIVASVHERLAD